MLTMLLSRLVRESCCYLLGEGLMVGLDWLMKVSLSVVYQIVGANVARLYFQWLASPVMLGTMNVQLGRMHMVLLSETSKVSTALQQKPGACLRTRSTLQSLEFVLKG